MRKFYVFHEDYDTYIEADTVDLLDGHLIFHKDGMYKFCVAIFAPGKWNYFKEVSIENV